MEIDHKLRFSNLMAKACAAYQTKPLDKETMRVYYEHLKDIPAADLERNLQSHIKTQRFFPKVADLSHRHEEVSRPMLGSPYSQPPEMSHAMRAANLCLLRSLVRVNGVDREHVKTMRGLKNALVEDLGDAKPTRGWIESVEKELIALGRNQDSEAKDLELVASRETFCIKRGIEVREVA